LNKRISRTLEYSVMVFTTIDLYRSSMLGQAFSNSLLLTFSP
jgi:hypothetical protein